MARLNIEIPDEIHRKLNMESAEKGEYLKDLIIDILRKHLQKTP